MSGTKFSRRRLPASCLRTVPPVHSLRRERNTKRRGELAELVFLLIATRLGFGVAKPYGDSERYDFILDPRDLSQGCPTLRGVRRVGNPKRRPPKAPCHPEERACCATKDLGVPRKASRSLRGINARSARILRAAGAPFLARSLREKWGFSSPPLWRVQVKCSTQLLNGLYRVNAHRRSGRRAVPYLPGEIDFIAAYIIPEDTWYIIPLHAVRGTSLLFRRKKDRRPGLYDQYRQAWHLLRPK